MTRADATAAWFHQLTRQAPRVDPATLSTIAEALANGEAGELLAVAAELRAVADVLAEEARCDVSA